LICLKNQRVGEDRNDPRSMEPLRAVASGFTNSRSGRII
jgi:hypothetical protein